MLKIVKIARYLLLSLLLFISTITGAMETDDVVWYEQDANDQPIIHLYFFWSKKCPHCLKARPDIIDMAKEYPWLKLHSLELVDHPENIQKYITMAAMFGNDARSVPAFMFCGNLLSGYERKASSGQLLKSYLQACHQFAQQNSPDNSTVFVLDPNRLTSIDVPFLGSISTADYSLPALTVFIAGMDAFNPCAFFVLLFLLSMMVHSRSRSRMALIGAIFVFFSGVIYFMFMAAWLNLFLYLGELRFITLLAGFIAVMIALLNIKDYFWFKKGLSLSISDDKKPELIDRIRFLLRLDSTASVVFATVVLASAYNDTT